MLQFENHGLQGGVWRGRLSGPARPGRVCLVHLAGIVAEAALTAEGGEAWRVEVALPARLLADGTQSLILIADDGQPGEPPRPDARHLGRLAIRAGHALDEDVLAEIAALRSELELLKREFRRLASGD